MKRLIPSVTAVLAIAFHLALPLAARAQGGATPEGGAAKPEKPTGVVKLDIEETLDKKAFRDTPVSVKLRKKLRELGFKVWTEKPLYIDEYEKKKQQKDAAKGATGTAAPAPAPTAPAGDERPAPDLVVKGKVVIGLDRTSTFFGGNVAFMYASAIDLTITDGAGKQLARLTDKDEWGKTKEKEARDDEIRRTAAFAVTAVLKAEPVQARLSPKAKAGVDAYVEEVLKNYPRQPPIEEQPQDGEKMGGAKEGEKGGADKPAGEGADKGAGAGAAEGGEKKQ